MFDRFFITQRGRALLAKAQGGVALNFIRMQIGDGSLPNGQNPVTVTALVHPIKIISISGISVSGMETAVSGQVTNRDLDAAFYFREIGLFASDPDYGEILYAYANAGIKADQIPAPYDAEVDFIFSMVCSTDNVETITFTAQPSLVFATQADLGGLQDAIDKKLSSTDNAASASKLKTPRAISLSGGVTGTATSFDGSADISIPVTALDVSKANAGTLPVQRGGTGGATPAAARTSLDVPSNADLAKKADKAFTRTLTLLADNWLDNQQTVAVPGVAAGAGQAGLPAPAPDSKESWNDAGITMLDSSVAGKVTFTCETVPNVDIPVRLILMEVVPT